MAGPKRATSSRWRLRDRATPAPTVSDITDISPSLTPVLDSVEMDIPVRGAWSLRRPTPALSDVSDVSDVSELTMLGGTPTPPPELVNIHIRESIEVMMIKEEQLVEVTEEMVEEEDSVMEDVTGGSFIRTRTRKLGSFASRQPEPQTSFRGKKRTRPQTSSRNLRSVKKARTTVVGLDVHSTIAPFGASHNDGRGVGRFGTLTILPQEIRQNIFALALDIACPVKNKQCCGPQSTIRERDSCKKHGKRRVKDAGRFNVLIIAKAVTEEATWVLYNQGTIKLDLGPALQPYFATYQPKTKYRLGDIPHAMKVNAMWMTAARYRFVDLTLSPKVLRTENPEVYTTQLCKAASLLFKGWEKEPRQPTSHVPHTVTVQLGELFKQPIPFNCNPEPELTHDVYLWHLINFPNSVPNYRKIAKIAGTNMKRLTEIVSQHRGLSEWNFDALSDIDEASTGARWMRALRTSCQRAGLSFRGKTENDLEVDEESD
ncbi:hypothetical protein K504DRAFT_455131 [Pleomassaria siparia CBS 279.74]|uniref:Uncharacterized protein n=1 Tax=Pleomassaria siparia CBS 279.74 TaxID=1314801 RepID=A0A6G1KAD5_9PLEO|nr:hypothetical protein K504DRAFT_455131 [Pleomassaria siparia CBS 279.74]